VPNAPLVVVNPAAGSGRAIRLLGWLRERLESRPDIELAVTARRGEAEELAAAAVADGRERVIAVGGDGTVQEVINGLLADSSRSAELGLVPVGTGNDLARSLGLPSDPAEAWTIALGASSRPLDVARALNGEGRERWFGSAGGIGFDAQVAEAMSTRRGWQAGRAGYLVTTLSELRRFDNRHVRLIVDGEVIERHVLLVAIANGAYYGGGMRIAPDARTDDGMLDICVVGDISRFTAIRQLPNLYRGTHVAHPAVSMHAGSVLTIESEESGTATRVHLDGEPFGTLPLTVSLVASALRIAAPDPAAVG
jgi:diacylglycerol kinase (ATP)